jgi:hypothetical protein
MCLGWRNEALREIRGRETRNLSMKLFTAGRDGLEIAPGGHPWNGNAKYILPHDCFNVGAPDPTEMPMSSLKDAVFYAVQTARHYRTNWTLVVFNLKDGPPLEREEFRNRPLTWERHNALRQEASMTKARLDDLQQAHDKLQHENLELAALNDAWDPVVREAMRQRCVKESPQCSCAHCKASLLESRHYPRLKEI